MDSNGLEITTPVGSEDTASLASYYDNAASTRMSSSYEDQSDESDSDHEIDDHEADIDKMLMDLEDFQVVRHPIIKVLWVHPVSQKFTKFLYNMYAEECAALLYN